MSCSGGFEAEDDDDDNKDKSHEIDGRLSVGTMNAFKIAVDTSVKNNTLKTGWFKKKRGGMMWQKRWVVLTEDYLVYYNSPNSTQNPRFAISLKDAHLNRVAGKDPIIEISSAHMPEKKSIFGGAIKKTVAFFAENEIELQDWLMPLKSVIGIGTFRTNSNKPVNYINYEIRRLWTSIFDKKKQTPLHYLAMNLHKGSKLLDEEIDVACWLIENGCDLNAQDIDGNTPLHLAVINNSSLNLLRCFLIKGSDIQIRNNSHKTPLSLIDKNKQNQESILKVLSSTSRLNNNLYIERNRLAFSHRSNGYSYLTIYFTKQDSTNQR